MLEGANSVVPDKLRQDRVFAISPGLFLVSVSMLSETSVSVAWGHKQEKKEECVWLVGKEKPLHHFAQSLVWLLRDTVLPLINQWSNSESLRELYKLHAWLEAPLSWGTRLVPEQHPMMVKAHLRGRPTSLGQLGFFPHLLQARLRILYELILAQYQVSEKRNRKASWCSKKGKSKEGQKSWDWYLKKFLLWFR